MPTTAASASDRIFEMKKISNLRWSEDPYNIGATEGRTISVLKESNDNGESETWARGLPAHVFVMKEDEEDPSHEIHPQDLPNSRLH